MNWPNKTARVLAKLETLCCASAAGAASAGSAGSAGSAAGSAGGAGQADPWLALSALIR